MQTLGNKVITATGSGTDLCHGAKTNPMETNHTQGPWAIETEITKRPKDCTRYFITADGGRITIAEFMRANHIKQEAEANARLIAMAPLLLDALEEIYKECKNKECTIANLAITAIKNATE